jgi:hypothetical protein
VLLSALRIPAPLESQPYAPASGVRKEKALLFLWLAHPTELQTLNLFSGLRLLFYFGVGGLFSVLMHLPVHSVPPTSRRLELKQNT